MLVTTRILRGVPLQLGHSPSPTTPVSYYTRKKKRTARGPRPNDHTAFYWNGSSTPTYVVRSPVDYDQWITLQERERMTVELLRVGFAFKTRKGPYMVKPEKGVTGWLPVGTSSRRFLHEHSGGGWNQKYPERDDGM